MVSREWERDYNGGTEESDRWRPVTEGCSRVTALRADPSNSTAPWAEIVPDMPLMTTDELDALELATDEALGRSEP